MAFAHHFSLVLSMFFVLAIVFSSTPSQCAVPAEVRAALVDLYDSTNGRHWFSKTNWLSGDPCENKWFGVNLGDGMCSKDNTYLKTIFLENNKVSGTLPSSLGDLGQNLTRFDVYGNSIGGTVPESFYSLFGLEEIDLSNNVFTGTISNSLSNLFNLEALILHNNKFEGTLPGALFENNTVFNDIEISSNKLTGEVPPGLWTLPALNRMMIDKNDFTGEIPVMPQQSFIELYLDSNRLTFSPALSYDWLCNAYSFDISNNDASDLHCSQLPACCGACGTGFPVRCCGSCA